MTTLVPSQQIEKRAASLGDRNAVGYSLGGATVDVETDPPDVNEWLQEYLTPWVDAHAPGEGGVYVRFTSAPEAFEALDQRCAPATDMVPCFALDSEVVMLPAWDGAGDTVLADRALGCFYRIGERRVDVVGRPGERRARLGLMRVVRELLTTRRLAHGRLLDLHAACFEAEGSAVLIAGPKYAGKTSLLCYALASGRARIIANDRVFVDVGRRPADVHGIPTLVSVRSATLGYFPTLRGGVTGRPLLLHPHEQEAERDALARGTNVRSLSPLQLAARLDASSVRGAPLAAVVFPEIVADAGTWIVDALSVAEGIARLGPCAYGIERAGTARTILEKMSGLHVPPASPGLTADLFAGAVRFFRCSIGPRAYERNPDEWLSALGLAAAGD